jgi:hypothetical protein
VPNTDTYERVFISHSSEDKPFVKKLVEILEAIDLPQNQVFCTSIEGYGIPIGNDPAETLKKEINKNVLVFFVLTENFYKSQFCLFEMGETWALSKQHIPIIIPPFTFEQMKEVFPLSQGIIISNELELNSLKERICGLFTLSPQSVSAWEIKRDKIVSELQEILKTTCFDGIDNL